MTNIKKKLNKAIKPNFLKIKLQIFIFRKKKLIN